MSAFFSSTSADDSVARRHGDADPGRDLDGVAVDDEGPADQLDDIGGERARLVRPFEAGTQNGEFVAAEARNDVGRAQPRAQPVRHGAQQRVADRMAERVDHRLELIEIEIEDRRYCLPPDAAAIAPRRGFCGRRRGLADRSDHRDAPYGRGGARRGVSR